MYRHDIPNSYFVDGIGISREFAIAFSRGCGGGLYGSAKNLHAGDIALFGDPATWSLLQQAKNEGRIWFYGDKAYFGRGSYYRITKNAYQSDCKGNVDSSRWEKLKIGLERWKTGSAVMICQQSEIFYKLHGLNRADWLKSAICELKKHTDRKIIIRTKVQGSTTEDLFKSSLTDIHAVVVHSSVAGVHAAINGVPCFATAPSSSLYFGSSDLSLIENPIKPDNRFEMACVLANNQWSFEEINNGTAWGMLNESLE